jgi:hypothetical protein
MISRRDAEAQRQRLKRMTENDLGTNDKSQGSGDFSSFLYFASCLLPSAFWLLPPDSCLYPLRLGVSAGEIPSYSWGPGRKLKWGSYLITVP